MTDPVFLAVALCPESVQPHAAVWSNDGPPDVLRCCCVPCAEVAPKWWRVASPTQRRELFDPFFQAMPAAASLIALLRHLGGTELRGLKAAGGAGGWVGGQVVWVGGVGAWMGE